MRHRSTVFVVLLATACQTAPLDLPQAGLHEVHDVGAHRVVLNVDDPAALHAAARESSRELGLEVLRDHAESTWGDFRVKFPSGEVGAVTWEQFEAAPGSTTILAFVSATAVPEARSLIAAMQRHLHSSS